MAKISSESSVSRAVPYDGKGSEFGAEDVEAVSNALREGTLANGPLCDRFEAEFAAFTGARHARPWERVSIIRIIHEWVLTASPFTQNMNG